MSDVKVLSHVIAVPVVDGVPQCPHHHEPLAQDGDRWVCPTEQAITDQLAAAMARMESRWTWLS